MAPDDHFFALLADNAPDAIFTVSAGRFTYLNPAALALFGATSQGDLVGQLVLERISPAYREAAAACILEMTDGCRRIPPWELTYLRLDGTAANAEVSGIPVGDGVGLVFSRDITERKRVEAQLRRHESLLQSVIDNTPALVFAKDREGRYLMVNSRFSELHHVSKDVMLGLRDHDLFPKNMADAFRAADVEVLRTGESIELEEIGPAADGPRTYNSIKYPLFDGNGEMWAVCGIAIDITARKRASAALRSSELRFHAMFEQAAVGIALFGPDGRWLRANPKICDMLGYSEEELKSLTMHVVTHPDDLAQSESDRLSMLTGEVGSITREKRYLRKDGTAVWTQRLTTLVKQRTGEPDYFVSVIVDIQARKNVEEELIRERDVAERTAVERSRRVATVSHEIRAPLHTISGIVEALRNSNLDAQQLDWLERLDATQRHLGEVVNGVLDLARIESGKVAIAERPLSIIGVIDDVCAMTEQRARSKGLRLERDVGVLPRQLLGDPVSLRQALLNYTSNAVKFTDRGALTVKASIESEDASGVVLRFEVTDTGPGIAADVLPKLFTEFRQLDNGDSMHDCLDRGFGLGLAITKRLASAMGGAAGAESTLGEGSRFWFTARLEKIDATELEQRAHSESLEQVLRHEFPDLRILLADDDEDNQVLSEIILRPVTKRLDFAADGLQAVAAATRADYDVILLDMNMPRMNGLEAARRLRALPGAQNTVILALTGNAFPENRAQCIAAGMDDLISKATGIEEPLKVILAWLRKRRGSAA